MRSLGNAQNKACIKKTLKLATTPEMIADVGLRPSLEALATHRKGIYALWRFISSGAWNKTPGLTFLKIAPLGEMVLDCLTKLEYSEGARKYLERVDAGVSLTIALFNCYKYLIYFRQSERMQSCVLRALRLGRHGWKGIGRI